MRNYLYKVDCSFSGTLEQQWDSRCSVRYLPKTHNRHSCPHRWNLDMMVIHNSTCNSLERTYSWNSGQTWPSPNSTCSCPRSLIRNQKTRKGISIGNLIREYCKGVSFGNLIKESLLGIS